MFAITGISRQVGGPVARSLFEAGEPVRAIIRSAAKGGDCKARGCEVALADRLTGLDQRVCRGASSPGGLTAFSPSPLSSPNPVAPRS
jgi:nucleoside-diphosphate-sugar epimerase